MQAEFPKVVLNCFKHFSSTGASISVPRWPVRTERNGACALILLLLGVLETSARSGSLAFLGFVGFFYEECRFCVLFEGQSLVTRAVRVLLTLWSQEPPQLQRLAPGTQSRSGCLHVLLKNKLF